MPTPAELELIGLGAALATFASHGALFLARRVQAWSPWSRAAVAGVRSDRTCPGPGRPGRVQGPSVRVPGREILVSQRAEGDQTHEIPSREAVRRVIAHVDEHVREFVGYMLADCAPASVRLSDKRMWDCYIGWTAEASIEPVSQLTFFTKFARHPLVTRGRVRVKDPRTGRVKHLESGSPVRETVYTITPPKPEPLSKLPGKVPVTELVTRERQHQPLSRIAA